MNLADYELHEGKIRDAETGLADIDSALQELAEREKAATELLKLADETLAGPKRVPASSEARVDRETALEVLEKVNASRPLLQAQRKRCENRLTALNAQREDVDMAALKRERRLDELRASLYTPDFR